MVLDTSAVVAWLRNEPEAETIEEVLSGDAPLLMSALSVYETRLVLRRRFAGAGLQQFAAFLENSAVQTKPFDAEQGDLAFEAFQRFGQGSGHKAQLNLCDCAAYVLAKSLDLPLLFKGNDFVHTGVRPALTS